MFDGMIDLAKTPMEMEDGNKPSVAQENTYPYGCSLSLDDDVLKKLGLDCDDPECQVGNYVEIRILAEVTGLNSHDTGEGKKHCLNLQATHMEITDGDAGNEEDEEVNEGHVYKAAGMY